MKKVPVQKYLIIFRAAVLLAVLSGLLFSCSEGIRLCPFPVSENPTANDTFQIPENEIAYQFNAHRFEDFSRADHKTESQTNYFLHFWIDNSNLFKSFSTHLISERKTKIPPVWKTFKLPEFSGSGESRAPPFAV